MGKEYTNRELQYYFSEVHIKLDNLAKKLEENNGRLRKLEVWRGYSTGAFAAIITILVTLIPFVFTLYD